LLSCGTLTPSQRSLVEGARI